MYLLGHTDPTLTTRVYQQVLDMGGRESGNLKGCSAARSGTPSALRRRPC
jgi:hypothetical protein